MCNYWKDKAHLDIRNSPESYSKARPRSIRLVSIFNELGIDKNSSILEIGCNAGRNLEYLRQDGYTNLHGFDISPQAIAYSKDFFPELHTTASIKVGEAPACLYEYKQKFDVVFTMAVLVHITTKDKDNILSWVKHNTNIFIGVEPGEFAAEELERSAERYKDQGILFSGTNLHAKLIELGFDIIYHTRFKNLGSYNVTAGTRLVQSIGDKNE